MVDAGTDAGGDPGSSDGAPEPGKEVDSDPVVPEQAKESAAEPEVPLLTRVQSGLATVLPRPAVERLRRWKRHFLFWREIHSKAYRKAALERLKRHDHKTWRPGPLASDASMKLSAIWVVEFYLPSSVGALRRSLELLGWDERTFGSSETMEQWISDARTSPGSWANLGLSVPKGKPVITAEYQNRLPAGVRVLSSSIYSLMSGVTAISAMFVYEDNAADELTRVMQADYEPQLYREPWRSRARRRWRHPVRRLIRQEGPRIRYGHQQRDSAEMRQRAAEGLIKQRRKDCTGWMARNLPGAFASQSGPERADHPTAELIYCDGVDPQGKWSRPSHFDTVGASDVELWVTDEWPTMRMLAGRRFGAREGNRNSLLMLAPAIGAFPREAGYGDDIWSYNFRADELVRPLLFRWGSLCLLQRYQVRLAHLRDLSANSHRWRLARDLKELRRLVVTELFDAQVASKELKSFAENHYWFRYDTMEPLEATNWQDDLPDDRKREPRNLLDFIAERSIAIAEEVEASLPRQVSTHSTASNLGAAVSGLRMQRIVLVISLASVAIAAAALYLAATASP